ncbi:hypothetical protein NM208_g2286 [Fusarium decemcellulare]|uniref:Uncharacterized protein n=1 Tax=Fusarium decemcellulare TaxID=57161 RepID=A0ACC1SSW8_9HYPO|nr:hypothetical protein NM208_g2286 [Fusarium decemcellulare]
MPPELGMAMGSSASPAWDQAHGPSMEADPRPSLRMGMIPAASMSQFTGPGALHAFPMIDQAVAQPQTTPPGMTSLPEEPQYSSSPAFAQPMEGSATTAKNTASNTNSAPHKASEQPPQSSNVPVDGGKPVLYVNAKQYHRILKRRITRHKLEEYLAGSKKRRPYLHESRHRHAMRRMRDRSGRFLPTEKKDEMVRDKEKTPPGRGD